MIVTVQHEMHNKMRDDRKNLSIIYQRCDDECEMNEKYQKRSVLSGLMCILFVNA